MRITVIGAGFFGCFLVFVWVCVGFVVFVVVRDPTSESAQEARTQLGDSVTVSPIANVLGRAEVIALALPGTAVDAFLNQSGPSLADKGVVAAANRAFGGSGPMNSVSAIRAAAPSAAVIRAFTSIGWENMAQPAFDGITADMLYCADASARSVAEQLIADVGLRPVLVGDLDQVHLVDALTGLWAALAYGQGRGRQLAFKILERAA